MTETDVIGLDYAWLGMPVCTIGPAVTTDSLDYSWFGAPVLITEAAVSASSGTRLLSEPCLFRPKFVGALVQ